MRMVKMRIDEIGYIPKTGKIVKFVYRTIEQVLDDSGFDVNDKESAIKIQSYLKNKGINLSSKIINGKHERVYTLAIEINR